MSKASIQKTPNTPEQSDASLDKKEKLRQYRKEYHIKHREKIVEKATLWNKVNVERRREIRHNWDANHSAQKVQINKNYRLEKRKSVVHYYSSGANECNCCGERMLATLTIDHMEGNGSKHRALIGINGGHNFYSWLIKNGLPEGYQVLCFNCNTAKAQLGHCPHRDIDSTIMPL